MNVLRDKRYWLGAASALVVGLVVPLTVIVAGVIDMSALSGPGPESTIGPWMLNASRRHHAPDLKNPFADDPKSLDAGLDHYRENCLICHGAPNAAAGELAKGLNPRAPRLSNPRIEELSDGDLFWTVKNGIKMTGMPAFGPTHTDEEIWHLVSAMRNLRTLSPEQTARFAGKADAEEHHHGAEPVREEEKSAGHDEATPAADHQPEDHQHSHVNSVPPVAGDENPIPPGEPGKDYTPVVVPNGSTLPWKLVDGVKVFHLVAEEFQHEMAPGLTITAWGYNGQTPGPAIEAVEGDQVRFYVTNHLPEKTSVHWHGILLPNGMDGVSGLTQEGIKPGETHVYEFTLRQHGSYMYHPHFDEMTQMAMGMMGMFVIHPRHPQEPKVDRDFSIMLTEWAIKAGTSRPDPNEMSEFNILSMNSKAFPGTAPLVVKTGERVRMRFGNLSAMDHHPIHLHGYQFKIVATDGGDIQSEGQQPETTVLVQVGSTKTIEFVADAPGDWALHCHMTHHVMNQMGHGLPNLIGIDDRGLDEAIRPLLPEYMTMGAQGMGEMAEMGMRIPKNSIPMVGAEGPHGYIDMGGMFTVLKVRDNLTSYEDPGWYEQPPGTSSRTATAEELKRDGVDASAASAPIPGKDVPQAQPAGSGHDGHHH